MDCGLWIRKKYYWNEVSILWFLISLTFKLSPECELHWTCLLTGKTSGPPALDPIAMMEFYMKKAAEEERRRQPKQSKDEMPPPASLQGLTFSSFFKQIISFWYYIFLHGIKLSYMWLSLKFPMLKLPPWKLAALMIIFIYLYSSPMAVRKGH